MTKHSPLALPGNMIFIGWAPTDQRPADVGPVVTTVCGSVPSFTGGTSDYPMAGGRVYRLLSAYNKRVASELEINVQQRSDTACFLQASIRVPTIRCVVISTAPLLKNGGWNLWRVKVVLAG
jgi:hypothetical protein